MINYYYESTKNKVRRGATIKRVLLISQMIVLGMATPALTENGMGEQGNGNFTVTYSNGSKIDITGVLPMTVLTNCSHDGSLEYELYFLRRVCRKS